MLSFVDLFCGCGGLSLGLQKAGLNHLAAFDYWDKAIAVYQANVSPHAFVFNLANTEAAAESVSRYSPDLIVGGPPCQDFSLCGKKQIGRRANLTLSYVEIIAAVRPKYFLMENVPPIIKTEFFKKVYLAAAAAGYGLTYKIADLSFYNVPQKRKRLFLLGVLGGGENCLDVYWKPYVAKKPKTVREYVTENPVNAEWNFDHYFLYPRYMERRCTFSMDEPSWTIVSSFKRNPGPKFRPSPNEKYDYQTAPRLNLKHAMDLQTFPKGFNLFPEGAKISESDARLMVANAVPVNAGEFFGKVFSRYEAAKIKNKTTLF